MTGTKLVRSNGETIERTGDAGFIVTATLQENDQLEVLMDFDQASYQVGIGMVGAFLAQLEKMYGEGFVTACFGHYAEDTGKQFMQAGDGHKIGIIRGQKRAKDGRRFS